ncbi:McrC family protein [Leptotrichia hongkongensis]|uniref:McrC family protein n=1 Tax=Leptotrichia hongkongensis TaxID=554406 RepID=UPI0035A98F12
MNKLLEVKEFDIITGNPNFKNDEKYKYLDTVAFENLIDFIHQFNGNEEVADALDFMKISYKRNIGNIVSMKNYVGLIQMKNGYQIQILPKISFTNSEDLENRNTKKIFLNMLRSMKDFPSKVFNNSNIQVDRMNLYEIFINMYLQEIRRLIKIGLKSNYIFKEDNLNYYKGKLLTSQHFKINLVHKERFYVAYDEFNPNRVENKLIKATLLKSQKLTTSAENSKKIRQLLVFFEMIDASMNYTADFSKVRINRSNRDYEMIMQWSKVFLLNKSFTTFSGNNNSRALLFPMEKVYESYVAKHLKKILGEDGWNVSSQDRGYYLFTEPRLQFALIPDIVCKRRERTIIMDTKWKKLVNNERINYGISQSDMYQMYAYSKKYKASEIWLLYPLNDEMKEHSEISFNSGDGTTVNIYFVDLENIQSSLEVLRDKIR